jgi:uncharacterized protein (DUF2252 family)
MVTLDAGERPAARSRGRDKGRTMLESFTRPRPPLAQRLAAGKALRQEVPRSAHAVYRLRKSATPVFATLDVQNATRVPHLVPVRMARMAASSFGFLRGSAAVMAADLAGTPATGLDVVACGDAHLLNFGLFASAERNLIFAINDFDEAHPGPWEWDLKRLAASAAVAAAFLGGDRVRAQQAAWSAVEGYVRRIRAYAERGYLSTWYELIDENAILDVAQPRQRRAVRRIMDKARSRGPVRALDRLTRQVDGAHQIVEDAPLIVRETHLMNGMPVEEAADRMLRAYLASLPDDRRRLLWRYRLVDVARKVVGVGSVGLGCWIMLFEGLDSADPLFLQVKQAQASVLAPHAKTRLPFRNQGQRVVVGQRMIQGSPDIFLGWGPDHASTGLTDFYVRQLADMKGGMSLAEGDRAALVTLDRYARLCGWALALAHAKSGDPGRISGYCGRSDALADAISCFALGYLEQTEQDHDALVAAVREGRVAVATPEEAGLV